MTIKGKDFKKAVSFIKEFLLKLPEDPECAELRDSLNLALLHMKKYFKTVWLQQEKERNGGGDKLAQSLPRGRAPSSLHQDDPDRFHWKWASADAGVKLLRGSLPIEGKELPVMPLILQATKEGDTELVQQLIEKDPMCVHAVDSLGRGTAMYAAHYDRLDCLDVLLQSHADPNSRSKDDCTACHVAVHGGNWEALEKLLVQDADAGVQDSIGRAPLHWAALLPDIDCLDMLLKSDVNRCPRDCDDLTPAMWACHVDNKAHFDLITTSGKHAVQEADGIERDLKGRTWIHWAVKRTDSLECLNSLLSPATVAMKDKEGRTAIHLAASLGAIEACRLIVSKVGPDSLHEVDNQNRTCVHLATIGGHGEVVNFLLDHGADANRLDSTEKTAWDYAEEKELHYCQMIINSFQPRSQRKLSRGRNQYVLQEMNNNSVNLSGNNPAQQQQQQQQLSEGDPAEDRMPSPPHQPRPCMPGLPPPKRGHSPRRPSPNRPSHPPVAMVQPGYHHTQAVDGMSNGRDHAQEEGRQQVEDDVVISPVDSEQQEAVQSQPTSEGDYVQSQEGAIIDSEMQPSSQVAEKEEQAMRGPRTPRRRSASVVSDVSEQSINFGMDVSDIEGEEGNKEEGRVNQRLTEPVGASGWQPHPQGTPAVNQKLSKPPRPPSPGLAPVYPPPPHATIQSSTTSPSAPPLDQIAPFTKAPLQSPPPSQPQQLSPAGGLGPVSPPGGLGSTSPRRLMPLGDPLNPQQQQQAPMPLPLPEPSPAVGAGGKGKKKKKRKGSSGGSSTDGSLIASAPIQPIAPVRSPSGQMEPEFGLRPPSPGFLPAPNQPNQGSKSPTPNSHFPAPPAPPSRNPSRSPQPPINQPHPSQEVTQMAPIQGGAMKQQQGRNGAWEVSWEPKRPGMPAPPITPRDGRGGGLPAPGPLLPQAPPPQGGLLPERGSNGGGKLSPRGPSPQPVQSPRGGPAPLHQQNKPGSLPQGGLTELQRPRTPQVPVTSGFPDTRGRSQAPLPAHPPPGRP